MDFSGNLKVARSNAGYTGREFADKLGIPYATLAGYENKGREPKFETLLKMADLLGVSVDSLLGYKTSSTIPWAEIKSTILECGYDVEEISDELGNDIVVVSKNLELHNGESKKIYQVFNRERLSVYFAEKKEEFFIDARPLFLNSMKKNLYHWIIQSQLNDLFQYKVFKEGQEQEFIRVVGKNYEKFTNTGDTFYEKDDLDHFDARVHCMGVKGLFSILESIIMIRDSDNAIWAAVIDKDKVLYFTNTSDTENIPQTILQWHERFKKLPFTYVPIE